MCERRSERNSQSCLVVLTYDIRLSRFLTGGRVRLFLQAFGAPVGTVIDHTAEHTDDAGKKENDHENQRRGNNFQRQSGINAVIFIF